MSSSEQIGRAVATESGRFIHYERDPGPKHVCHPPVLTEDMFTPIRSEDELARRGDVWRCDCGWRWWVAGRTELRWRRDRSNS